MKSSFWPNLGLTLAVGDVAAGGDIDILEPDAALEPDADVARLAIVLPVVAAGSPSGTRLTIATPWCICWPFRCWWT